jgi:hypothetical protein
VDPLGHWRAISKGDDRSATARTDPLCHQVRLTTRQNRSASQADSASPILVTRSNMKVQVGEVSERWTFGHLRLNRVAGH